MKPAQMVIHADMDDRIAALTGVHAIRHGIDVAEVQLPGPKRERRFWPVAKCEPYPGHGWQWDMYGTVTHATTLDKPEPRPAHLCIDARLDVFRDSLAAFLNRPKLDNLAALRVVTRSIVDFDTSVKVDSWRRSRRIQRLEITGLAEAFEALPATDTAAALLSACAALLDECHAVANDRRKVARFVPFFR